MNTWLWTERVSRLFFMSALAWLDAEMFQSEGSEKSSLMISSPTPGRISGVGGWVDKICRVGVADGGNQFMVAVGSGVSVGVGAMGVARMASSWAQEVKNVIARRTRVRRHRARRVSNFHLSWGLCRHGATAALRGFGLDTCTARRRKCTSSKSTRAARPAATRNDGKMEKIIFIL